MNRKFTSFHKWEGIMKIGFLEMFFDFMVDFFVSNAGSILIIIVGFLLFTIWLKYFRDINILHYIEVVIPKGINIGGFKIVVNKRNKRIAYQIWVELVTRKIAIEFDEVNDVIHEVYNSWYSSFGIIRNHVKDIGEKKVDSDLRKLSISFLNDVLRPHLTKYQSRFRTWYSHQEVSDSTVQEIQKQYPDYDELIENLKLVNSKCIEYIDKLERIYK